MHRISVKPQIAINLDDDIEQIKFVMDGENFYLTKQTIKKLIALPRLFEIHIDRVRKCVIVMMCFVLGLIIGKIIISI